MLYAVAAILYFVVANVKEEAFTLQTGICVCSRNYYMSMYIYATGKLKFLMRKKLCIFLFSFQWKTTF